MFKHVHKVGVIRVCEGWSMETLTIVISSSPYGDERIWNALRLAEALCCTSVKAKGIS